MIAELTKLLARLGNGSSITIERADEVSQVNPVLRVHSPPVGTIMAVPFLANAKELNEEWFLEALTGMVERIEEKRQENAARKNGKGN